MRFRRSFVALASALMAALVAADPPASAPAQPSTVVPVPRDENWIKRHEMLVARARQGGHELVFLGDSITEGWSGASPAGGSQVWRKFYGTRRAINLGIGGDRTQHVLWRLDHGLLDALAQAEPKSNVKAIVLMIGTNNSNGEDNTPEQIAEGVTAIVKRLRAELPRTKILLLAIFPRGEKPDAQREKNARASALAAKALCDDSMVKSMDIGPRFLAADGTLSTDIAPDLLHLSEKGYTIWAEAIEPVLADWLRP
jgi:beta-glucosidase